MNINQDILKRLQDFKIEKDTGLTYLIGMYLGYKPKIPEEMRKKIFATNIFEYSKKEGVIWKIPLLEDQDVYFEWVKFDFRNLFARVNIERGSTTSLCTKKMKIFFAKNPHVRKEDVIKATEAYIRSVDNPQYIVKADNFIYDDKSNSLLLQWIEDTNIPTNNQKVY
jgi:hypothetical protein